MRPLSHYGYAHLANHCAALRHEATPEARQITREEESWTSIEHAHCQERLTQIHVVINRLQLNPAGLSRWMGVEDAMRTLFSLPDRVLHIVLAWLASPAGLNEYREAQTPRVPASGEQVWVDPANISGRD